MALDRRLVTPTGMATSPGAAMKSHYDFSQSKPLSEAMGVAKIDMYKRSNVTSPLDSTLNDLLRLRQEIAETALSRPSGKSAFDYGRMCGFYQGIGEAIACIEKNLNEGQSARTSREES